MSTDFTGCEAKNSDWSLFKLCQILFNPTKQMMHLHTHTHMNYIYTDQDHLFVKCSDIRPKFS